MRKYRYLTSLLLLMAAAARAQQDTIHLPRTYQLQEYIYAYNKFSERKSYVAQPVSLLNRSTIEQSMAQNAASLLEKTGEVFVQRSQQGGGSPVLRGFEASRVLMLVDGVRMNNAIYRAGHLQNVITVDNTALERVEVLYGPGSTLYGSDALGGVIHFITRAPKRSSDGKTALSGSAFLRTASANDEQTVHADINIGRRKWASFSSATFSSFGDLRQGASRSPLLDSFGKRYEFIDPSPDGKDLVVSNPDPNVQRYSGYKQYDLTQKFLFAPSSRVTHTLNLQLSNSSDIPRYDRLTEYSGGKLRYANWYYGPQFRAMGAYQFRITNLSGFFDEAIVGVNYQAIEESRHQRSRGSSNLQSRIESVDVLGYHIDLRKSKGRHELTLGTDGQYNWVASEAHQRSATGETPISTRYPDGGSTMYLGAVYGHYLMKAVPEKLILNGGIRLNYTSLRAEFIDKTFYPLPYTDVEQQHTALSGNLGLVYFPAKRWRIAASLSSGFRSPNVDDLVKVFESAGGASLIIPNTDLRPEKTYTGDINITYTKPGIFSIEAGTFLTRFTDAIILSPATLGGADSVVYDGKLTAVMAAQNKAAAWLQGAYGTLSLTPEAGLRIYSTITYTYGRYRNGDGGEVPLDHIPPVYGKTGVSYEKGRVSGDFYALYNGWKEAKDYSPSGEDNLQYATRYGMPSWYTLNLRATVALTNVFTVQAALENIFDKNYRTFASGISAPGRNFLLTLRARF